MKKMYQSPSLLIVKVNLRNHLLVASETETTETGGGEGTPDPVKSVNTGARDIWNDEW